MILFTFTLYLDYIHTQILTSTSSNSTNKCPSNFPILNLFVS